VAKRKGWREVGKAIAVYRRQFVVALLRARRVDGRFVCGLCGRRVKSERGLVAHAAYRHPVQHREALLQSLRKATGDYGSIPSSSLHTIGPSDLPPPTFVIRKRHMKSLAWVNTI